jgi:hypothetical protein
LKTNKESRIARAEARSRPFKPVASHIISLKTTEDAALDEYGRDRIGKDDFIVFLVGVEPPPRPDDDDFLHRNSP